MALSKDERRRAFSFSRVDLSAAKTVARDAEERFPRAAGGAQQLVLSQTGGKLVWIVTVGTDWNQRVWYDVKGNHLKDI